MTAARGTNRTGSPPVGGSYSDTAGFSQRTGRHLFSTSAAVPEASWRRWIRQGIPVWKAWTSAPARSRRPGRGGLISVTLAPAVDYLKERRGRYALITVFSVLEHQTRSELFDLLDAIRDALIPGGSLIAVVPNAKGLFGAHVRFADITHELSFSPSSVSQVCSVTGLELADILEHGPLVHGLVSAVRWAGWQVVRSALLAARVAEGADWRWPVFTQDLVFVARKPASQSPRA